MPPIFGGDNLRIKGASPSLENGDANYGGDVEPEDQATVNGEFIEQGQYIKLRRGVDCDECTGTGESSWYVDVHNRNSKALASIGFGEGISNTVFGGRISYEAIPNGETNPRNIKYGTAWTLSLIHI